MVKYNVRGGDPNSYSLGRGKIYLAGENTRIAVVGGAYQPESYQGGTPAEGGWRDAGNCTAFTVTQESETKEHRSSLQGIQVVDLEVPVSQKMRVAFTLDEINLNNLARFFSGEFYHGDINYSAPNASCIASDNALFTGVENVYVDTTTDDQVWDLWYDLKMNYAIAGLTDVNAIDFQPQGGGAGQQNIQVRKQATTRTAADGTLLTEGTHYEVDRRMGRIRFIPAGAGGINRGDTFQVKWNAPTNDVTKTTSPGFDTKLGFIKVLTNSGVTVSVKFIGENPNDGDKQIMVEFWKVKLKPDGDYSGIGDDWTQVSFSGTVESIPNPPSDGSPYGRIIARDVFST